MSILIDDRGGAKKHGEDYPTKLQALLPHSELCRLDSGDVAFAGNGVTVGIELKTVTDALSCMYSSRLADVQLPAMAQHYDVRYLIIQDLYRAEPGTGILQRWKSFQSSTDTICGRWYDVHAGRNRAMYHSFEMWLHSMSELGGARLERTNSIEHTAMLIQTLYTWWNRQDHHSYNVLYNSTGEGAVLSRPTTLRRIAALLPKIGWTKSKAVADHFGSIRRMINAESSEWLEIDGIGKGISEAVAKVLNDEHS